MNKDSSDDGTTSYDAAAPPMAREAPRQGGGFGRIRPYNARLGLEGARARSVGRMGLGEPRLGTATFLRRAP